MACGDPQLAFRMAVLDPDLTLSQPAAVTAAGGFDAIAHAVETAVTKRRNAISTLFSREAFRLLNANYERVLDHPDDVAARGAMQLGAFYAGVDIEQSMLGAAHACANPLTARYDMTHGVALAILLPHVVRWNAQATDDLYRELRQRGAQPSAVRAPESIWRNVSSQSAGRADSPPTCGRPACRSATCRPSPRPRPRNGPARSTQDPSGARSVGGISMRLLSQSYRDSCSTPAAITRSRGVRTAGRHGRGSRPGRGAAGRLDAVPRHGRPDRRLVGHGTGQPQAALVVRGGRNPSTRRPPSPTGRSTLAPTRESSSPSISTRRAEVALPGERADGHRRVVAGRRARPGLRRRPGRRAGTPSTPRREKKSGPTRRRARSSPRRCWRGIA